MAARRVVFYLLLFYQISGIAIFLKGFFPLKKNTSGISARNIYGSQPGKFDRLIIVMIDALRADFVFGNNNYTSFTKSLITHGETYSFQAHSNPPTVTMPRIKAITTGTIPGFIDVILNVDSKELSEDNIVAQMKNSNKKIIFYGDDTWIKLFPSHFVRHEGTTSFFVTDYIEVDNNVTRHVVPELDQTDWDVMILHYLGLDHIGHLAGPTSPLVRPKLNEMDQVIELIYTTAVRQDFERNISTLMVLCGDHGMSDGGSHGGSSPAETTTPLVFMSSLLARGRAGNQPQMKRVNQIDITPTLAILFGLPIPKNNIGILIPDLLTRHSVKERLEALRMNAVQISNVYQSNMDNESVVDLDFAVRLHDEWLRDSDNKTHIGIDLNVRAKQISKLYYSGMQVMSNKLTKFMSSYDFYALYIGIWLLLQSLLGSVSLHVDLLPQDLSKFISVHFHTLSITFLVIVSLTGCIHVHLCSTQGLGTSEVLCVPSMLSVSLSCIFIVSTAITILGLMIILSNMIAFGLPTWFRVPPAVNIKPITFLVFGLLLHNISLLSTSFIEEEHQTWYFLTTTYHLILLYEIHFKRKHTFHSYSNEEETSASTFPFDATSSTGNVVTDNSKNRQEKNHVGNKTDCNWKRTSVYMVILLLCNRTLRSWNQTGIKWADQPDVGDWLVNLESKNALSSLMILSLVGITLNIFYKIERNRCGLFDVTIFTAGEVGVYLYRAATGCVKLLWSAETPQTGIHVAQFVHLCVLVLVLKSLFQLYHERKKGYPTQGSPLEVLLTGYVLLITLLLRTHNIPLVALMLLQVHVHREVIWKRCDSNVEIILSAYYLGWFTYFAQGNSNSLATVDIGAGYIGLGQNYWPAFVGLFTSLATFSGPLFWLMQAVMFIQSKPNSSNRSVSVNGGSQVFTILLIIKSFNLTVCTILSWLNCYHLFVWSVFSPKLLYEGVVSLVLAAFILTVAILIKERYE